jgi:hypothetical protein
MKFFIIALIIVKTLYLVESRLDLVSEPAYCLIKNIGYEDEFLYSCQDLDITNHFRRKVYTNRLSFSLIKNFDQIRWILVPVQNKNSTYFIINAQYRELFCASTNHLESIGQRRKVNMLKIDKDSSIFDISNQECMWQIDKEKGQDRYYILNSKYNEPLYAASSLLKSIRSNRRNVFTWHSKPDNLQFVWYIYCFTKYENNNLLLRSNSLRYF